MQFTSRQRYLILNGIFALSPNFTIASLASYTGIGKEDATILILQNEEYARWLKICGQNNSENFYDLQSEFKDTARAELKRLHKELMQTESPTFDPPLHLFILEEQIEHTEELDDISAPNLKSAYEAANAQYQEEKRRVYLYMRECKKRLTETRIKLGIKP